MEPSTTNYSWNIPQRQSPAAIFIMLLQTAVRLVKTFWPILIVFFIRKQKDQEGISFLWILLGFGLITVITTILKYWFHKFYISNESLIIQSGWLKKKTLTLPLKSIQAVHLEQNIWQQFLKVARVTLDSSGSEKVEVKIDALTISKAEELKQLLLSRQETRPEGMLDTVKRENNVLRLSMTDLLKLSLSANHLEAFFILFGLSINLVDDVKKIFNIDGWEVMGDYAGKMEGQKILAVSILIIFVAIVSMIISIIRTMLKYYDFRLEDTVHGWKIFFGLITRQQLIVPFNKIQVLSWRANWVRRKLDFWIIHVQAIGHDEVKHKQRINIPVTCLEQVIQLSRCYQESPVFDVKQGSMIEADHWKRKLLFVAAPATVILLIIFYLIGGYTALWILLLFPVMAWYHHTWYLNFRWMANEEGIQMYSGVWGRRYTLLTWKKIQQVELKQSLYQRSHDLATLKFITAGGSVSLFYVPFDMAKQLTDRILYYVESRKDGWM